MPGQYGYASYNAGYKNYYSPPPPRCPKQNKKISTFEEACETCDIYKGGVYKCQFCWGYHHTTLKDGKTATEHYVSYFNIK